MSYRLIKYYDSADPQPVVLPLSKSVAARVITVNFLSESPAVIEELPDCDDCRNLEAALGALRESLEKCGDGSADKPVRINIGSGAAPFRFFLAMTAAIPGTVVEIETTDQLRWRPVAPLVAALRSIGADIEYRDEEGYPPLVVKGRRLEGGSVEVDGSVSSQFVSALMMIAPVCTRGLIINLAGGVAVSLPYIEMTAQIMRRFGVNPVLTSHSVTVEAAEYKAPAVFAVEPDWSAASYFYERALLGAPSPVYLKALAQPLHSMQGDSMCCALYRYLGVETEWKPDGTVVLTGDPVKTKALRDSGVTVELDLGNVPDLVPSLAVTLCGIRLPFRFTGISHLRHKECDRLFALSEELGKMGYMVETDADTLSWNGRLCPAADNEPVEVYGDHRMAMAFAPLACVIPWVNISSPEVVGKSFADFWQQIESVGLKTEVCS